MLRMNSVIVGELFRVGNQGVDAVISDPLLLTLIKVTRVLQVLHCFGQQNDRFHELAENRRLTSSSVRNLPSPRSILARRPATTRPCHSGEGTSSGEAANERQSSSTASNRSRTLIPSTADGLSIMKY